VEEFRHHGEPRLHIRQDPRPLGGHKRCLEVHSAYHRPVQSQWRMKEMRELKMVSLTNCGSGFLGSGDFLALAMIPAEMPCLKRPAGTATSMAE